MAVITELRPQAKDKTRCNLYLDGAFVCGLSLETVVKNRLKVGMEVDADELARLQEASELQGAIDKALTHISLSMKTDADVRSFLKRKGYLPPVIDAVMEKLVSYGYVDDREYAKRYASSMAGGKSRRLIGMELKKKGVGEAEIEESVGAIGDERETAKKIFLKYMRGKRADRETIQKAYRHLLSKGFDYDTAKSVVEECGEDDSL